MAMKTFAAIDVGSFDMEMGIYEISTKFGIREIDHLRHTLALGKETYNDGRLSYALVEEMCGVLKKFTEVMKSYRVDDYRACAASALREAKNSQIVLDQISVRTGLNVKTLSNSELRFLSYKAVASRNTEFQKTVQTGTAIMDVGFGSSQISLFDKDTLVSTQNLKLGVLRISEMAAHWRVNYRMVPEIIEEMVESELYTFKKMYLKDRQIRNLIVTGESIIYMVRRGMKEKTRERFTAGQFKEFCTKLIHMTLDEIEDAYELEHDYAAILVPSAIIYKTLLDMIGAENVWTPGIRLCDGIAAEYGQENKLVKFHHDFTGDILSAARNMAKRYKCHGAHAQEVERAAVAIFNATKKYHGLGERERLLLQIAAILHACGKFISITGCSESSYQIVMATEIIGLSHLEQEIVANVVCYNIQEYAYDDVELSSDPSQSEGSAKSGREIKNVIAKLTAILRLANSMDRGHRQKLADCRLSVRDNELVVTTAYAGNMMSEVYSFNQKADFFEEIFGIRPVIRQKRRS